MNQQILIVDDEPNIRLSYRMTLETEGYPVTEAASAAAALDAFKKAPFCLAILDMRMPDMDGLELLAEMRKRGLQTPAVIVTAFGDIPHAVRAMKLGAIDFLQKPLTPDDLRKIVNEIVVRHEPDATAAGVGHDNFDLHVTKAKRLLNLQEFAKAREHLIRALELDSSSAEAFNLAGVLFEMQEDYERARKYYGQAIKLDKHYEAAQQNMRRIFELFHFGSSDEPFHLGEP